ncbi:MAG TPA: hypothetical protein VGK22_17990 [Candidatus Angelobacter sp.]|jgi:hypothetical protein
MVTAEKTEIIRRRLLVAILLFSAITGHTLQAPATHIEGAVTVTVDASKVQNFVAPRAMGMHTSVYDNHLGGQQLAEILRSAGITTLRYPGGGYSDNYHWSVHKMTRSKATDPPQYGYIGPNTDFGHFLQLVEAIQGTAIITVNYGSNLAGTGGGEPAEAAAWVAYANGSPADPKVIGKDSTGYDWKTVGYWASLRASKPLDADDGQNFLRITHAEPFHIRYWEIGNEIYGNGYYEKDEEGYEGDLHAPYDKDSKVSVRMRRKNRSALSPQTYGKNVVEYARAMKAVDATAKIGAVLNVQPMDNSWGSDWNPAVMKECGTAIDFVSLHWYTGNLLPPDWKTLDDASYLSAPERELPDMMAALLELFRKYGGENSKNLQLVVTEMGARPFAKIGDPYIHALFVADAYLSLMQDGAANIDWLELHKPSFLDDSNKPGPVFFALQMIHRLAQINDSIVAAHSSHSLLAVHAIQRKDGSIGLLLINKDPKEVATVKIKISGVQLATNGLRFDYGPANSPNGYLTTGGPVSDLGNVFTLNVPAYSITDIVMAKAK